MKKELFLLSVFSFLLNSCYSNSISTNESTQIKKVFSDSFVIRKKEISGLKNNFILSETDYKNNINILKQSIEETKKSIDDTRLRESLKSAESIINNQNSLINNFGNIFTILAIFIALVTLGVPILIYYLTIKPANRALKRAKSHFISEIQNYNEEQLNEAIENLKSKNHLLIKNSLNHILSLVPKNKFTERQIYNLYTIAKYENIDSFTVESIAFLLSNHDFTFCKYYFFDILNDSVETIKENNLKNYAFNYLIKFHKSEKYVLTHLNSLIIKSINKKESIIVLLDWLVPDNEILIWELLNFAPLVNLFDPSDLKYILKILKEKDYIIQEPFSDTTEEVKIEKFSSKLKTTLLSKKIIEFEKDKKEEEEDS